MTSKRNPDLSISIESGEYLRNFEKISQKFFEVRKLGSCTIWKLICSDYESAVKKVIRMMPDRKDTPLCEGVLSRKRS